MPRINTNTFQGRRNYYPDIMLIPMISRIFLDTIKRFKDERSVDIEPFMRVSSTIMYRYTDKVLAKTRRGGETPFKFFESMDYRVYILLLLSVIVMSLVVAIPRASINSFLSNVWSHLSIILSDTYSVKTAVMSTADRLLTGVWLMSCFVVLAAFSGLLRDLMIKPKPIYWIDSWDDLAEWQHMKIATSSVGGIEDYITNFANESMAQNFVKRKVLINIDDLYNDPKRWDTDFDYEGVRDGRVALVGDLFYLNILKQNLFSRYGMIEDLDFHISKSDNLISQPSFIMSLHSTMIWHRNST